MSPPSPPPFYLSRTSRAQSVKRLMGLLLLRRFKSGWKSQCLLPCSSFRRRPRFLRPHEFVTVTFLPSSSSPFFRRPPGSFRSPSLQLAREKKKKKEKVGFMRRKPKRGKGKEEGAGREIYKMTRLLGEEEGRERKKLRHISHRGTKEFIA